MVYGFLVKNGDNGPIKSPLTDKIDMIDNITDYDHHTLVNILSRRLIDIKRSNIEAQINKQYQIMLGLKDANIFSFTNPTDDFYTADTNILTIMILYNKCDESAIYIMDNYDIMPDIYTLYFANSFRSYDLMAKISDKYFDNISNVKIYNTKFLNLSKYMIDKTIELKQFDKFEYILRHDPIVIDILKIGLKFRRGIYPDFSVRRRENKNKNKYNTHIRGWGKVLEKHTIGPITETYNKLKTITKRDDNEIHKIMNEYIIENNRWDLIVTGHYNKIYILKNGSFGMIKKFADMLDILDEKYSHFESFNLVTSFLSYSHLGLCVQTPYSIHLSTNDKTEMKLSLFEKDKYNSNTFSCVFPEEGIIEPVKYYTDTNIYRILDILDKCLTFDGIESKTKQIILTVTKPKYVFDKYITSLITGIIPLVDASITECIQFMFLIDEYQNRMITMKDIYPYVYLAFKRDISNGNYFMDDNTGDIIKDLCHNYQDLKHLYFLIRNHERTQKNKNKIKIKNTDKFVDSDITTDNDILFLIENTE